MNLDKLEKLEISNRAKKKLELRDYLLAHPESTPLATLLEHYSREQVNFFVEQGALTILQKKYNVQLPTLKESSQIKP